MVYAEDCESRLFKIVCFCIPVFHEFSWKVIDFQRFSCILIDFYRSTLIQFPSILALPKSDLGMLSQRSAILMQNATGLGFA